jgi:hypothetical protein
VVEDVAKKRVCLHRVLQLNPDNKMAQQGLAKLEEANPLVELPKLTDIVPAAPPSQARSRSNDLNNLPEPQTIKNGARLSFFLLIGLHLLGGLCFAVWNPNYFGRLILPCRPAAQLCSQPVGWIILAVIALLVIISSFIIYKVGATSRDPATKIITIVLCVLFLSFPAFFILLLGPALLILMETNFG